MSPTVCHGVRITIRSSGGQWSSNLGSRLSSVALKLWFITSQRPLGPGVASVYCVPQPDAEKRVSFGTVSRSLCRNRQRRKFVRRFLVAHKLGRYLRHVGMEPRVKVKDVSSPIPFQSGYARRVVHPERRKTCDG